MKPSAKTHEGRVALVGEGKLKFEITKYPLSEAAKVHQLFEARKTSGKVVLIP